MLTLDGCRIVQGDFALTADFAVNAGARVSIIGPSGAGKSTLLAAIAGFLPLAGGRILWTGKDIAVQPPGARPLSIIFQDNNLFPHLTAFQNVALGLKPSLRLAESEAAQVRDALARTGLAGLEDRKPSELSGGQQSRVALARVLLRGRPILLMDEPFAALGPALRAEMLDLVKTLAAETGATLLMVSHDPADAKRLGGQTVVVAEGRAEPPVETGLLFADPPQVLRDYLGD
ncbi:thiamine ABC transporter ATP-binding protein [Anianabacter salinae]|uniref:thiamine ABC transporter ATP-binding protein n=1 Tax=Anianabacter salinae TaxID=2851023 RepID=UPI00225E6B73|nr:ATP-binding cassette domain-containing protein [Anianabacter salinae]MBV0913613.1 ATP-binding cassette domain-containing protein [Anianabacter salinae]